MLKRGWPEKRYLHRGIAFLKGYSKTAHSLAREVYDVCIIGGGIIGLATARELLDRYHGLRIAVLEKEDSLATHQTGHNSGVVHAGIYYRPGSLKAKLCVQGLKQSYEYFDLKSIAYRKCGKLVVATNEAEVTRLQKLFENGKLNNVPGIQYLSTSQSIKDFEPKVTGLAAIYSPNTGIVDWKQVANTFAKDVVAKGGDIRVSHEVVNYTRDNNDSNNQLLSIQTRNQPTIYSRSLINCGGLYSDTLANLDTATNLSPKTLARIIPIIGQYLQLPETKPPLTTHCIYPVPTPNLPFLGVHITPTLDNKTLLGPNALPSLTTKLFSTLSFKGTYKLLRTHYPTLFSELLRAVFPRLQINQARQFLPDIPSKYSRGVSGVRAQLVGVDGSLIDDFVFERVRDDVLHARNCPSPGATSSLAIAQVIADKAKGLKGLE